MDELQAMKSINDALEAIDDPDTRDRIMSWACAKFASSASSMKGVLTEVEEGSEFGPSATRWLKQNNLSAQDLEQVFDISPGSVEIIVGALSGSKKEQTVAAYLLQGAASLLASDQASFTDQQARDLCDKMGCYDVTNHSKNVSDLGNRVTGSKKTGWKLTAPGLIAAATTVRTAATGSAR